MPRQLRVEYAGACYHVINRGNFRRNLFEGSGAAEAFVRTLSEAAVRFGWRVHAYVVMRNHFHLALELTEPNLSEGMKWLQGTWTRRYNGFRRLVGRPFQGRFKGIRVEPGHSLSQVCHYIHLNPARAHAVTNEKLSEYRWSSLAVFPQKQRPAWMEPSSALCGGGQLADNTQGWRQYQKYLHHLVDDAVAKAELCSKNLSRGWCLGSDDFRKSVRRELEEKGALIEMSRFAGLEPEELQQERRSAWEQQLERAAKFADINLKKLPAKKSSPEKVVLAAVMKQSTSVSNQWLAVRLGMGKPATVSQFVRRALLDKERNARIQQLLSRVKA